MRSLTSPTCVERNRYRYLPSKTNRFYILTANARKKKHHYVWKIYLKPWTDNEQVPALFKNSKKIINTNPEGIEQQRYFYALKVFTEEEEIMLKEFWFF